MSRRDMLDAPAAGQRGVVLDAAARRPLLSKISQLVEALQGRFTAGVTDERALVRPVV
jgi:hypothetical protein